VLGLLIPLFVLLGVAAELSSKPPVGNALQQNLDEKLRLARTATPKIIILSGSNGEYGYSAQQIEQRYGIPAVNMGEHAGQGLDYILYRGSLAAQKGDLFILPMEYEQYESIEPSGDQLCAQVILHDGAYRRRIGFLRWAKLVISVPLKTWTKLLPLEFSRHGGNQQAEPLNRWGDPERDTDPTVIRRTQEALRHEPPRSFYVTEESVEDLKAFHHLLEEKGGQMVVIFPCIYGPLLDSHSPQFQANVVKLKNLLQQDGIPVLGNPEQFTFSPAEVYDTIYHENAAGRERSTARLMGILKSTQLLSQFLAEENSTRAASAAPRELGR
jgi:hypothetical protein